MCRHLAFLGEPLALEVLLGAAPHGLVAQSHAARELLRGSVCGDGFGVGWFADDAPEPATYRREEPIWADRDLAGFGAAVRSGCAVASVRNATPGMPGGRDAVMPFAQDGLLFAHNGYVEGFREHSRALREALPDRLYQAQRCGSDAEALFLDILRRRDEGSDLIDAVTSTLGHVSRLAPGSALNVIAAERDRIVASRAAARQTADSLYLLHDQGVAVGGTLVASEPLDADAGWSAVPEGTAVILGRNKEPTMIELAEATA